MRAALWVALSPVRWIFRRIDVWEYDREDGPILRRINGWIDRHGVDE